MWKQVEIIPSSDEARAIVEQISANQYRKPIFVFAADGAMAPIRTEEKGVANCWKEVTDAAIFLIINKLYIFSVGIRSATKPSLPPTCSISKSKGSSPWTKFAFV